MASTCKCCKDCEKRFIGCHSTCEEYLAWHAKNEERLAYEHRAQDIKHIARESGDRRVSTRRRISR